MKTIRQPFAKSSKVYYFYSFLFGKLPLGDELGSLSAKLVGERVAEKIIQRSTYARFEFHIAEEKEPLQFRSDIYLRFPHFSISPFSIDVATINIGKALTPGRNSVSCVITKHIALFESGMGVMSVVVNPVGALDSDDIIHISRLGESDSCCSLNVAGREVTPFLLFEEEIEKLKKSLDEVFRDDDIKAEVSAKVEWIEKDRRFVKLEPGSKKFQEAHVAVILGIGTSEYGHFFGGSSKAIIDAELQAILHKEIRDKNENTRVDNSDTQLVSLFDDRRFVVCMHSRVLLVCYEEANNYSFVQLEEQILKGLFRTLVALRGTWHFYLISNEILDCSVKLLFDQFEHLLDKNLLRSIDLLEKEKEIIKAKGEFLRNLAVEDPLLRAVGLSPYSSVYSVGSQLYRTEDLKTLVWRKARELDNLFGMVDSYVRRIKFTPQASSSKTLFSSYLIPFLAWSIGLVSFAALHVLNLPLEYYTISWFLLILAIVSFIVIRIKVNST